MSALSIAPITGRSAAPGSAISQGSGNIGLSYTYEGAGYSAWLRCTKLSVTYGLNAEQSHSRQVDAFYPHRRDQGTFAITFNHIGWHEYNQAMAWFARFCKQALAMGRTDPAIYIEVSLAKRNFHRYGVPTTGMGFGDHTASMVFSPVITFVSAKDLADPDPNAAVLTSKGVSKINNAGIDPFPVAYFYPNSAVNKPGKLDESLFGTTGKLPIGTTVAQTIIATGGTPTNVGQSYQQA